MKTQQCCVLTTAIGTILVGIAMVLISRFLLDTDVVIRNLEPSYMTSILVLGISVSFVGLLGVCGACFSSPLALAVYGIGDLIAAIAGLIFGSTLFFMANMHGTDIKQSCSLVRQAGSGASPLGKKYQTSYDSMKQALMNCRRNGRPGALGLQDCGELGRDDSGRWFAEDPQREVFWWSERLGGCGGFCTGDLPLFGHPLKPGGLPMDQTSKTTRRPACYNWIADELQVRGSMKAALLMLLSLPLFIAVCGTMWILCHPPPRRRKEFDYTDGADHMESDRLLSGSPWGSAPDSSGSEGESE